MGDTGIAFVAAPQIPPRNMNWMKKGMWVRFAKVVFEKYFMRKMKKGISEPIFEKYVLKEALINSSNVVPGQAGTHITQWLAGFPPTRE